MSSYLGPSWKTTGGYEKTEIGNYASFTYWEGDTGYLINDISGSIIHYVGPRGPTGPTGITGPTGPPSYIQYAEFYSASIAFNQNLTSDDYLTFDLQNSNTLDITKTTVGPTGDSPRGTVFTIPTSGVYAIDYESSFSAAVNMVVWYESAGGTQSRVINSTTGSAVSSTWIHGRTIVILPAGDGNANLPYTLYVTFIKPPDNFPISVVASGGAGTRHMTSITFLKLQSNI